MRYKIFVVLYDYTTNQLNQIQSSIMEIWDNLLCNDM